jgi:hypothetical protein
MKCYFHQVSASASFRDAIGFSVEDAVAAHGEARNAVRELRDEIDTADWFGWSLEGEHEKMWGNNVAPGPGSHCTAADLAWSTPLGGDHSQPAPQILMLPRWGIPSVLALTPNRAGCRKWRDAEHSAGL